MTTPQFIDEISILERIAQQDQTALGELYDRYASLLYAVALKILGSAEEAEEVVLDVFSQVWRTAKSYDSKRGRVDGWLFVLTRSRALDRLRALKRTARAADASIEAEGIKFPQAYTSPEQDLLIEERRTRVQAAINQLPSEQREVIELAYFKGLTHIEIAAYTGKSLGTVKTRIRLGLRKLRDALGSL